MDSFQFPRRSLLAMGIGVAAALRMSATLPARAQQTEENALLLDLLRFAPMPTSPEDSDAEQLFGFADIASQLAAVGIEPIESFDSPEAARGWIDAVDALLLPAMMLRSGISDEWSSLYGFTLPQIDSFLEYGVPPTTVAVLRGRFDRSMVESTLIQSGYESRAFGTVEGLSLPLEDGRIDLKIPASRLAMGAMNHVVFADDETMIASSSHAQVESALESSTSDGSSLANDPTIEALVNSVPTQLASAMLLAGGALIAEPRDPENAMPPVILALTGISPGGPIRGAEDAESSAIPDPAAKQLPQSSWWWSLLVADTSSAETIPTIVAGRIAEDSSPVTDEAYAETVELASSEIVAEPPIAVLELDFIPPTQPVAWRNMIYTRDVEFLTW